MPSAERRVRVRSHDPARTRAALAGQAGALGTLVRALCARADAGSLLGATRIGGRTVRELVVHLGAVFDAVTDNLGLPAGDGAPLSPTDWVSATRTAAPASAPASARPPPRPGPDPAPTRPRSPPGWTPPPGGYWGCWPRSTPRSCGCRPATGRCCWATSW
ncbi:hypothetical protein GXW82_34400 [Streptacidiphilus sp. 4-A2]|nr:hypothetical protein [Streptacidiphilus sp. 4-A2]